MTSSYLASLATTFILSICFSLIDSCKGGFSVDLIHRESPKSPFYNPSQTLSQCMTNALQRSIARARHLVHPNTLSQQKVAQAQVVSDEGDYLMKYSIGTPPFEILGIVDTGSDLIWSQCKPCQYCYKQDAPLFDPSLSSTYKNISCSSSKCTSLQPPPCSSDNKTCQYNVLYGDQSYSYGDLAYDTITLRSDKGRPVSFHKRVFGCGHNNKGNFNGNYSGIVGLGGGPLSLVSQLSSSIGGKFSYCLVPAFTNLSHISSKLSFGKNAKVSGHGIVSTPIAPYYQKNTYYYLTLEAMSVGNKKFIVEDSFSAIEEGNIIIDSGTTLTFLPQNLYSQLEAELSSKINLPRVHDPSGYLRLCYNKSTSDTRILIPVITAHFRGADVKLKPANTFARISEDIVCFAFKETQDLAIYGNLAQMNFLVGYDLKKNTLSFKPTDCTKT